MFFCEPCREQRDWPMSFSMSHGPCEICKVTTGCYDVPSSQLPVPKAKPSKPKPTKLSPDPPLAGPFYRADHGITFHLIEVTVAGPRFGLVTGHRRYSALSLTERDHIYDELLNQWRIATKKGK